MKRIAFIVVVLFSLSFTASSQKLAYFDLETVLNQMPEMERAKAQMEKEQKDLYQQLEEMQVEFNKKYQEYQQNVQLPDNDPNKWSKTVLQFKEQELMEMQQKMQQFQQNANQMLQQRQVELLQPVYDKLDSAAKVLAQRKGYYLILKKDDAFFINKDKVDDVTKDLQAILNEK